MSRPRILVVEDNDVTRRAIRLGLVLEGYSVMDCGDGRSAIRYMAENRPDLILQDILLPDVSGFELVRALRALPGGAEVPILALTGLLDAEERGRLRDAPFNEILAKPVEPSRLVQVIHRYLPRAGDSQPPGRGNHVLYVDDDRIQRRVGQIRLSESGFRVSVAEDGADALQRARRDPPDFVISDVLMPDMDGFELCRGLHSDPVLRDVPVALVSSNYIEPADCELAFRAGARGLFLKTPDLREPVKALLGDGQPRLDVREAEADDFIDRYLERVRRQLERQMSLNASLSQRCTLQALILSIVASLSDALANERDVEAAAGEALYSILDVSGVSMGALYFREHDQLRLAACCGFPGGTDHLRGLQAEASWLARALERPEVTSLSATDEPESDAKAFLEHAHVACAIIVPLLCRGERVGALVLGSDERELQSEDWRAFARTIGVQLGQAIGHSRTLAQLTSSDERYRTMMENANDAISILDLNGVILEANRRAEQIFGHEHQELIGKKLTEFMAFGDDSPRSDRLHRLVAEGSLVADNLTLRRGDGTFTKVDFSARVVAIGSERVVFATARDVTERCRLEQELRQAQKMEAIGRLTGGIAHDFNNLLAVILANSAFLLEELGAEDQRHADAEGIKAAADRAASLTRQLLAFSRRQILKPELMTLNAVVTGLGKMLGRLIGEDIELVTTLEPDLPLVKADAGQIEQVLVNLAVNSRDAMPKGGRLQIKTESVTLGGEQTDKEVPPGQYVVLTVTDSGCGMDAEIQSHLFEPFFTTKGQGKGTGLGLSTCYGIVKQSGGQITVETEVNRGTSFRIYLPQAQGTLAPERRAISDVKTGSETILVVEDDDQVRAVVQKILHARGYKILATRSCDEACAICQEYGENIDLLLSDVVMPKMTGPDGAAHIKAMRPGIKVLFMSGYTEHPALTDSPGEMGVHFIQKPFAPDALAARVRDVLNE
jgi:PAS domain S-box-containing protein